MSESQPPDLSAAEVIVTVQDGVATLRLNAPERRNALRPAMAAELCAACDRIDADPSIGAVVVCGAGEYFCAGADRAVLEAAAVDPAGERAVADVDALYEAFIRVGALLPPTVAAVRGGAVGAGVNLAMAADLRVIGRDAELISGFLRLGLHPGGGHFALIGRAAGRETAAALGVFGEVITGAQAVSDGLAWVAADDTEVEQRAHVLARRAAKDPALARRAIRSLRLQLDSASVPWPAAREIERAQQMWSMRRLSEGSRPSGAVS